MTVKEKLYKIIAKELQIKIDKIKPTSNFINDLGADSLDIVELLMAIEQEFDVAIDDLDAESINTVNEALEYLQLHVEQTGN